MKKLLFTLVGVMFFAVASFGQGKLKFNKMIHDFGNIPQGWIIATYTFEVTNTGTAPVVITNAQASCGCTTPEWSKDPIMPGVTKTIKVGYTTNTPNAFNKTITVISNAENATEVLRIKGVVVPKSKGTSGK